MRTSLTISVLLAVLAAGCAERQAQVAAQASLNALAHGLVAADGAVADAMPDAAARVRADVVAAYPDDAEAGLAAYDRAMQPWTDAVVALRELRAALTVGQGALTCWIEEGSLPDEWRGFCAGIGQVVAGLVETYEALGIASPEAVQTLAPEAGRICELVGPWLRPSGD